MRLMLSGMVPVNRLELKKRDSMLLRFSSASGKGPEKSFSKRCNVLRLVRPDKSGRAPVNVLVATFKVSVEK